MIDTSLVYIEHQGCYLMLHRIKKEKDVNKDKWIGIGGKFLPDETPLQCALRETLEETGLTLIEPQYCGIVDFKSEGFITGMAAKMFIIAGPVIVYGTLASVIYGIVLMLTGAK